jgi:hypothetical protein
MPWQSLMERLVRLAANLGPGKASGSALRPPEDNDKQQQQQQQQA